MHRLRLTVSIQGMDTDASSKMIQRVRNDRFAKMIGARLVEAAPGRAVAELELKEDHLNGVDRVQGGVIFTLADYAFAAASNAEGFPTVGVNVNISYFRAPRGPVIRAVAREIQAGKRICGYQVDVLDADGSLVASFAGMGYRKPELAD